METKSNLGPKHGAGITRAKVLRLYRKGLNASEIGRVLGISREGVRDHLKRLRAAGELPEQEAS